MDSGMVDKGPEGSPGEIPSAAKDHLRRCFFGDIFKEGQYQPLHRELFDGPTRGKWEKWLAPSFFELKAALGRGEMPKGLKEEAPGIYSFELFRPEFCDMLLEEVEHAQRRSRDLLDRPNGMNRYGIVLNQLGLEPLITALQQEEVAALQAHLFPTEAQGTNDHHCFIVRYKADEDVGLDMHEDDSDITLNVCLGKEFKEATLSFCGRSENADHRKLKYVYKHQKGRAVIHLGRHRHGADDILSGERVNFILWSVSSAYRNSPQFRRLQEERGGEGVPDKVCLSYTHDADYTRFASRPSKSQALARGVMLDRVEERIERYRRPIHDLARPLEEINSLPTMVLFLEGLPPQEQHRLMTEYLAAATAVLEGLNWQMDQAPPLLFHIALQKGGAVPQVRALCGCQGSPKLVLLNIDKQQICRFDDQQHLTAESIQNFAKSYFSGALSWTPLAGE